MFIIAHAAEIATLAHEGQKYGEHKYVKHLYDVSETVYALLHGQAHEEWHDHAVMAAWLHDALEDTFVTAGILRNQGCPEDVVLAIELLTKTPGYDYNTYIQNIRNNRIALLVKRADTLCNLRQSMVSGEKRRFMKYIKQLGLLEGHYD